MEKEDRPSLSLYRTPARSTEMEARLTEYMEKNGPFVDFLDNEPLYEYDYWFIINNEFPYDLVTDTHHLLIPKRVIGERKELSTEEREELEHLMMNVLPGHYEIVLEKLVNYKKTVLAHLHIHLIGRLRQRR